MDRTRQGLDRSIDKKKTIIPNVKLSTARATSVNNIKMWDGGATYVSMTYERTRTPIRSIENRTEARDQGERKGIISRGNRLYGILCLKAGQVEQTRPNVGSVSIGKSTLVLRFITLVMYNVVD